MDSASRIKEASSCLELALEGERLCKCGDFASGVSFFLAAIKASSSDLKTLSAIYSQLGNAYFYLNEYEKALNYHEMDLRTARAISDRVGEGKASGNLGNTLKMLNRFDEAVEACQLHLQISRELGDKVGEARALYNLGNVYHTKGKELAKTGQREPGDLPDDVKNCLKKGVYFYRENLHLMTQIGDKCAQGRALGNLGNIHYLLGNFEEAIAFHTQRLKIAQEFCDKAAERRAHCNLGNAHVFLSQIEDAVHHYHETLRLARELQDQIMEAQACYSLGNCYTLMHDYEKAIEYHILHLQIASDIDDRVGEGRACWSLSNSFASLGRNSEALTYAKKHLDISRELRDQVGSAAATAAISELKKIITSKSTCGGDSLDSCASQASGSVTPKLSKRLSMDQMQLLKLTPGLTNNQDEVASSNFHLNILQATEGSSACASSSSVKSTASVGVSEKSLESLDRTSRLRLEDNRSSFNAGNRNKENRQPRAGKTAAGVNRRTGKSSVLSRSISSPVYPTSNGGDGRAVAVGGGGAVAASSSEASSRDSWPDEMFDLIAGIQGDRMNEQRAQLPPSRRGYMTNGLSTLASGSVDCKSTMSQSVNFTNQPCTARASVSRSSRQLSLDSTVHPEDDFFEMLMRCQGSRLEEQRSSLPPTVDEKSSTGIVSIMNERSSHPTSESQTVTTSTTSTSDVPDDDFLSLILRLQSGRIEDQRSNLPSTKSVSHEDTHSKRSSKKNAQK